ncbi:MAG: serine hydrolase domain-containing protein [bacterium]
MLKIKKRNNRIVFVITALVIIFGSVYNLSGVESKDDSVKNKLQKKNIVSATALEYLSRKVEKMGPMNSFQISYRGEKIVEDYYRGINKQTPVNVKSVSKSVLSALVGIALDEGVIKDLDRPAADYLPGLFKSVDNKQKKNITLRHLLLMSSGLRSTSEGRYGWWVTTDNWRRSALAQPLVDKPGSSMSYSTGDSHLLASVLDSALGSEDLFQDSDQPYKG